MLESWDYEESSFVPQLKDGELTSSDTDELFIFVYFSVNTENSDPVFSTMSKVDRVREIPVSENLVSVV